MARIYRGDRVRSFGRFYNNSDSLTAPTNVYCSVKDPDDDLASHTVTDTTTTGVYYLDIDADKTGRWYVYWQSTGGVTAASETEFLVRKVHAR